VTDSRPTDYLAASELPGRSRGPDTSAAVSVDCLGRTNEWSRWCSYVELGQELRGDFLDRYVLCGRWTGTRSSVWQSHRASRSDEAAPSAVEAKGVAALHGEQLVSPSETAAAAATPLASLISLLS